MTTSYEKLAMLIDGEWTAGSCSRSTPVINPATEETLGELPFAATADLDRALDASQRGFAIWKRAPAIERQAIMEKAARLLEERRDAIARNCTLEIGKPIKESRAELDSVVGIIRWYAEEGKRAYGRVIPSRSDAVRNMALKEPIGPVVAFAAWNFPGVNVIRKVAGALAAGCSIVVKPSEETPATAIAIARCFQDAGLPDGVLNVVFGEPAEVSRHLLASRIPKKVTFTGSVPVGIHLQKLAADTLKRCTLELGGHAPFIVFDDADVEAAARLGAQFKFRNAGQVCTTPSRFFVQSGVHDRFLDALRQSVSEIVVGDGLDPATTMGPLAARRRLDEMERIVHDASDYGASVVTGGMRLGKRGWFYAPTILDDVPDGALIMREEQFGPVAPIARFDDLDEVIERANSVDVGLASYVFTGSGKRANVVSNALNAGMVGVNGTMISLPETPFGGVEQSGYGSEGGVEGLNDFLRTKLVAETH
ncbi:NAD-dependent succinate-semialdehyde dehydrogenase [Xanthobacter sp. 126]|uniref:NAD-dependent succinate-semialdehyde dehydrogenase n=1 Tax=Xanthobacter sp. 126 TaxID=1131814 RepID=UPI00045E8CC6|nr:NAD-dependent succinate-semialdehyde dehydrogenase [Xanthobacter sp. 126]